MLGTRKNDNYFAQTSDEDHKVWSLRGWVWVTGNEIYLNQNSASVISIIKTNMF